MKTAKAGASSSEREEEDTLARHEAGEERRAMHFGGNGAATLYRRLLNGMDNFHDKPGSLRYAA